MPPLVSFSPRRLPSAVTRLLNRYASFVGARAALVIGRWMVLVEAARHLRRAEFATLAAALSVSELLKAFSDSGADSFVYSRLGSIRARLRPTVRVSLLLRERMASVTTLAAVLLASSMAEERYTAPVFLLVGASVLQANSVALLQKQADFQRLARLVGLSLAASAIVATLAISLQLGPAKVAVLLVTPDLCAAVAARWLAREPLARLAAEQRRARRSFTRVLRVISGKLMPSAGLSLLVIAYSRLDVSIVRPLAGPLAQADYSAGLRCIEPAFLLFAIASTALLAELGSGRSTQAHGFARRLVSLRPAQVLLGVGGLAILCSGFAYLLVADLLRLRPGIADFAALLALGIPIRVLNSLYTALLQRLGHFNAATRASLANGLLTFAGGATLTLAMGASGAALAAICGELLNWTLQRRALKLANDRAR